MSGSLFQLWMSGQTEVVIRAECDKLASIYKRAPVSHFVNSTKAAMEPG
jgi:hypothetical protein